jgi:polyisoprenoid-binding protein YceI
MIKLRQFAAGATLAALATSAHAGLSDMPAGTYELDSQHGYVTFSYTHLGFSRPVIAFRDVSVELDLNPSDPGASALTVEIDPASVDSGVDDFDDHLRNEDFFDVDKHPEITFVATSIALSGDDTATVTGDLTIKGITKPVTLDATINKTGEHPFNKKPTIGISATGKLLRSEWALGKYAPAVTDEVVLNLQVELNQPAPE